MKSIRKTSLTAFVLLTMLSIFSVSLKAQDLIVTNKGDSVNCKITKIKGDHIYFVFKHQEEIRRTLLPTSQVDQYQYNYYDTPEVTGEISLREIFPRYRVALNGGWSYRIGKTPDNTPSDLKSYASKLKSGFHYSLDAAYFFNEYIGAGGKYSNYLSKNRIDNVNNASGQYGTVSDDISIQFVGPYLSTRLLNANKKNALIMNFALGYMGYSDKGLSGSRPFSMKGSTFGTNIDFGYDIGISKNLAIGFQISLYSGYLTECDVTTDGFTSHIELKKENYESLSRIEVSVGLRFY